MTAISCLGAIFTLSLMRGYLFGRPSQASDLFGDAKLDLLARAS
jgi:hypothetical protein